MVTLAEWLRASAAVNRQSEPPVGDDWVTEFLGAIERPGDIAHLPREVVDQALWNVSGTLDEVLNFGRVSQAQRLAVLQRLPELTGVLDSAGFGNVTAFSYFWEGFASHADALDRESQASLVVALRRVASMGTEATLWTVLQALDSMHGTPGAADVASELLQRDTLPQVAREHLARVHSELVTMEERLRPPR